MILSEEYRRRLMELSGIVNEKGGTPRNMSLSSRYATKHRQTTGGGAWYPFHRESKKIRRISETEDINELETEDICIPSEYVRDKLSPALWRDGKLDPNVRKRLMRVARDFYQQLEIDTKPKDIKIVGSMANYTWSKHSDIDLHLFFDISEISKDTDFAKAYLDAKKKIWNDTHNITIKGHEIEVYSNDVNDKFSGGVYSIMHNKWEKEPSREKPEIDFTSLKAKIKFMADKIEEIERASHIKNPYDVYKASVEVKDKIKKMRKSGLESGGEFSIENLAFKYLRNNGYINRLVDVLNTSYDKSMSIS